MSAVVEALNEFQTYVRKHIKGDEKGEAQVFLDRLFKAFGHRATRKPERRLNRVSKRKSKGTNSPISYGNRGCSSK